MKANLILLLLAALLAVPTAWTVWSERGNFTEIVDLPLLFDGLNPDAVTFIHVQQGFDEKAPKEGEKPREWPSITLQRQGVDSWLLASGEMAGLAVLSPRVNDDVLGKMQTIRRDEKALLRPDASDEELKEYGLDGEQGTLLQLLDAQQRPLASLVVGKQVSEGQRSAETVRGRFVRSLANRAVLVAEEERWDLSLGLDSWIDKKIFVFEPGQAVAFELRTPQTHVKFVKDRPDQPVWKPEIAPPDVGAIRQGEVATLLQRFSYIDAQKYVARNQPQILEQKGVALARVGLLPQPQLFVSATLANGESYTLSIGGKQLNEHYATSNQSDFLFMVGDWVKANFEKHAADPAGMLFDRAR